MELQQCDCLCPIDDAAVPGSTEFLASLASGHYEAAIKMSVVSRILCGNNSAAILSEAEVCATDKSSVETLRGSIKRFLDEGETKVEGCENVADAASSADSARLRLVHNSVMLDIFSVS